MAGSNGYYMLTICLSISNTVDNRSTWCGFKINGAFPLRHQAMPAKGGAGWRSATLAQLIYLASGDYLEIFVNNQDADRIIESDLSWMTIHRVT